MLKGPPYLNKDDFDFDFDLDMDHVAGHDVAGLPLLFDPYDEFVFKFWPLAFFSPVAALVLRHALELFNLLTPIRN